MLSIEDNRILREGICAILNEQPDITAVATSGNGDALLKAEKLAPQVVLLPLGLQSQSSLRIAGTIKTRYPKAEVVVIDPIPVQTEVFEFVRAGAPGLILKDATIENFLLTIRSVAEGKNVLPPPVESLFSHIVAYAVQTGTACKLMKSIKLAKREHGIVNLIAKGMSNKEIAGESNIAVHTVNSHIHNALEKTAIQTRLELASFALSDRMALKPRG